MDDRKRRNLKDWGLTCALTLLVLETANPCINVVEAGSHPLHPVYPVSPLAGVFELFMVIFIGALGAASILLSMGPQERRARPARPRRAMDGRETAAGRMDADGTGIRTRPPGGTHGAP